MSITGVGASIIPLGFLIGSLPIAVCHLIELALKIFKRHWSYEVWVSDVAAKKIWAHVTKKRFKSQERFYASATFDHSILPKGVNAWIMRRWNAFNTNINCCSALLLAHAVGSFLSIDQSFYWWATTILVMMPLLINAIMAYCQTMRMIEFQANRNFQKEPNQGASKTPSNEHLNEIPR